MGKLLERKSLESVTLVVCFARPLPSGLRIVENPPGNGVELRQEEEEEVCLQTLMGARVN